MNETDHKAYFILFIDNEINICLPFIVPNHDDSI